MARERPVNLLQFDDVLKFERRAINRRRAALKRQLLADPRRHLINRLDEQTDLTSADSDDPPFVDADNPPLGKTQPRPVPCCATGLAFSGGGIRSTAVCLGALQALHRHRLIACIDYLSTVSGGGYIGCCLSAAMSRRGGGTFEFGEDGADTRAVAHLRNYSNYLMPRGRSAIRNLSDVFAIIIRGMLANFVLVLATLLISALITWVATRFERFWLPGHPFGHTLVFLAVVVTILILWSMLRSVRCFDTRTDDTNSPILTIARLFIVLSVIVAFLEFQPLALAKRIHDHYVFFLVIIVFSIAVSLLSSALGRFLIISLHAKDWTTFVLRGATHITVILAGIMLPAILWFIYLVLSDWIITDCSFLTLKIYVVIFCVLVVIACCLRPNSYSLHRFYRDRLSKAFLFHLRPERVEPEPLDNLKLSELKGSAGPYHIINAAMNVQGSVEANRRGRDADFFIFTPDFVGSDLTLFAPTHGTRARTEGLEEIDSRLDVATAMAISGAAVSANMGSQTIRALSPTLALLNIRLGYWLRNPRDLRKKKKRFGTLLHYWTNLLSDKLFILPEMLNLLDELSPRIYLTDGGHIENLGVYELIKRGCKLIIVVDAEADPHMAFRSLMKLDRYSRIDFGVRIRLPYDRIASVTNSVGRTMEHGAPVRANEGPHCAIGCILYENGEEGIIVYFKASLTGDERGYVLDYKHRNAAFPHETTSDQFFSEEQFEVYRDLGFHMVDKFFNNTDEFSFLSDGPGAFPDRVAALTAVMAMLTQMPPICAQAGFHNELPFGLAGSMFASEFPRKAP